MWDVANVAASNAAPAAASNVSTFFLSSQTHDVTAFYLKIWLEDELAHLGSCPWEDDWSVCESVCAQAGVPLESLR